MLHAGVLPHHPKWAKLFENLRFVIIDELHAYRGVFGSHLANVLRRLRRICQHYGSNPVFICSSATIANPRGLAERLVEQPFELVEESGAPRGEKYFLFVNPPVVNRELGIRRSYLSEARRVASEFLKRHLQLIVFCQSRLSTEILTTYLKEDFDNAPGGGDTVRGYRGGYLPKRRREIERGLREGTVRAVVSTNALELGIDIGALDVVGDGGLPRHDCRDVAASRPRGPTDGTFGSDHGREQRTHRPVRRAPPVVFLRCAPEHALVNPDNLHILVDHIKCAAFELPFTEGERFGREDVQEMLAFLQGEGFVHRSEDETATGQWNWTSESYPADAVSLRSISSDNFVIVDVTHGSTVIGETDFTSGPSTLHEKAIYIVEGKLYQVERLDFDNRKAFVREVDCDYYTDAITYTKRVDPRRVRSRTPPAPAGADGGRTARCTSSSRVVGFKKIKFHTNENVGSGELDLPEQQMHTTSYWLTVPRDLMRALPYGADDRRDGVIGLSFAMRQVAQLLLMCDRQDIGISIGAGDDTPATAHASARPSSGRRSRRAARVRLRQLSGRHRVQRAAVRHARPTARATRATLIAGCGCDHGCPTCVGPVGETGPLAKQVALAILDGCSPRRSRHDEKLAPACANYPAGSHPRRATDRAIAARRDGPSTVRILEHPPAIDATPQRVGRGWRTRRPRALGGEVLATPLGPCVLVERRYAARPRPRPRPARATAPRDLDPACAGFALLVGAADAPDDGARVRTRGACCSWISRRPAWPAGPARYAFLVGCAWFDGDGFRVRQYFMVGHALERALLGAVRERLDARRPAGHVQRQDFRRARCSRRATCSTGSARRSARAAPRHAARRPGGCGATRGRSCDIPGCRRDSCSLGDARARAVRRAADRRRARLRDPGAVTFRSCGAATPRRSSPCSSTTASTSCRSRCSPRARSACSTMRPMVRIDRASAWGSAACSSASACWNAPSDATRRAIELADGSWHDEDEDGSAEALRALALRCRRTARYAEAATHWERLTRLARCPVGYRREALEALAIHHEHRSRDLERARLFAEQSERLARGARRAAKTRRGAGTAPAEAGAQLRGTRRVALELKGKTRRAG